MSRIFSPGFFEAEGPLLEGLIFMGMPLGTKLDGRWNFCLGPGSTITLDQDTRITVFPESDRSLWIKKDSDG